MSTTPPDDATTPPAAPAVPTPPAAPSADGYGVAPAAAPVVPLPPENVVRGLLLALLAIPAGVLVFVLVWQLGIVAGIVGFAIAAFAFFLYRLGSGGRVTLPGAVVVPVVTLVTLVLAILAAQAFDLASGLARTYGLEVWQVLLAADFPSRVARVFSTAGYLPFLAQSIALPVVFGLVACIAFLRPALKASKDAPVA
jgi:hypothetical protein